MPSMFMRTFGLFLFAAMMAVTFPLLPLGGWGPAAYAQDEDTPTPDEIENMADPGGLPSTNTDEGLPSSSSDDAETGASDESVSEAPKKRPVKKKVQKKPVKKKALKSAAPQKKVTAPKKTAHKKTAHKKTAKKTKSEDEVDEDGAGEGAEVSTEDIASDEESSDASKSEASESVMTEERDPVKRMTNARELAVRVLAVGRISVLKSARKYVPKDLEVRLVERLVQDLAAKTYFEPQATDGSFNMRTRSSALAAVAKKGNADGVLVFEIGLEEIKGYLAASSGRRIRTFEFKYKVGELEEKNAVSILSDRLIEGFLQAIPYRGFVTSVEKRTAKVNLGSNHSVKEGDLLDLFEFRRPNFNSTQRFLYRVRVRKVLGPSESQVELLESAPKDARIEPFAKVSFAVSSTAPTVNNPPMVMATDHSVVDGRWWFEFGGELVSYGADATAPQYESKTFRTTNTPFFFFAGGNDLLSFRGSFGSGRSDTETLGFFDASGTYTLYQFGSAQSAWTIGAGPRIFYIHVTPNPNTLSALESTIILSPMVEFKYQYVPRGRIRLVGTGEVFWPVYTSGADIGALPFAFGAGVGGALQLAITSKFGFEVFGKVRYLRRPIQGQSGVQERQSILGAGLLFSF